jgi:uncharacterized protein
MPGDTTPEFSLYSGFTPRGRQNLAAYMAVDSNPQSPDYGKIEILQFPQETVIPGPDQIQNSFESYAVASEQLKLLRGGGSKVILGNLVTIPLGGSLLSVEPVYVQASSQANAGSYPQLQKVLTFYYFGAGQHHDVGFGNTLAESLAQLFHTSSSKPVSSGKPSTGHVSQAVLQFLAQAQHDYSQAQAALKTGNLGTYYTDILAMKKALDQAQGAAKTGSSSKTPSPSASSSPKPSSSPSP